VEVEQLQFEAGPGQKWETLSETKARRTGCMEQLADCLLTKCETLSLTPPLAKRKNGILHLSQCVLSVTVKCYQLKTMLPINNDFKKFIGKMIITWYLLATLQKLSHL
jgi:hypothetical protein